MKNMDKDTVKLLGALRDFVSYGRCRQKNQWERNMLAERFAVLAEQYEPLLAKYGVSPGQMSEVDFEDVVRGAGR